MNIAVVGGGIIGITAAHALLDDGHAVTIVDPADQPGRACDGNAGWIAHMDIMPLASSKAWRHVPRWLADPLGPLAIRPAYAHRAAPWILRLLLAARPATVEQSIVAIRALNAGALAAWRARLDALSLSAHLKDSGCLTVWGNAAHAAAAEPLLARQRAFGIAVERLDRAALHALEPALGEAAVAGALYPTGAHVSDPQVLTAALADAARARGAVIRSGRVRALEANDSGVRLRLEDGATVSAERTVVAAGAWSRALAASLGETVPLDTERGYNITAPRGTLGLTRPVAFEGEGFVTTPLDTGDRLGGAVEFAGLDAAPNHARSDAMTARLRRYLPHLPERLEGRRWMGFRPSIPDSLPVIGPSAASERVLYAFGHGHYGLTQATVTAQAVADLVAGRTPALDLAPFSVRRFGRVRAASPAEPARPAASAA